MQINMLIFLLCEKKTLSDIRSKKCLSFKIHHYLWGEGEGEGFWEDKHEIAYLQPWRKVKKLTYLNLFCKLLFFPLTAPTKGSWSLFFGKVDVDKLDNQGSEDFVVFL